MVRSAGVSPLPRSLVRGTGVLLAGLAAACGSRLGASGRTESGAAPPAAPPSASSPVPRAAPPADPPGLRGLAPPAPPVCVLSAADWSTAYPDLFIELGTSGSPVFAHVRAGHARLTIGAGGGALLEVATPRLTVRGYPTTTPLVYTRRAVLFGGWLINLPRSALTLVVSDRAGDGEVAVDGPSAPHVRALARYGETAVVACDELALVLVPFDPAAVLPAGAAIREGYLPEAEVPLSLTPGGAPVAILKAAGDSEPAWVLEERGAQARIVWNDDDEALVLGWIDRAARSPTPPPRPPPPPAGAQEPPAAPREAPAEVTRCPTRVRLVEGGRYGVKSFPTHVVGTIEPQTPIGIVAREETPGYASITLGDEAGVRFPEGALLLAPSVDLVGCRAGE